MTRWYEHRFHNTTALRMIFVIMPRLPRFLHPPVAAVTALIFFLILKRERRAVTGNLRRVSGKRGLALQWKVYWVFYSFCDLMVSYCFVPQATHSQLLGMLVDSEKRRRQDRPMPGCGQWAHCVDGACGELGIRVAAAGNARPG